MSKASETNPRILLDELLEMETAEATAHARMVGEILITADMAQAILDEADLDAHFVKSDADFQLFLTGLRDLYVKAFGEHSRRSRELRSSLNKKKISKIINKIRRWRALLDDLDPAKEFFQATSVYRRALAPLNDGDSSFRQNGGRLPFHSDVSARLDDAIVEYVDILEHAQKCLNDFDGLSAEPQDKFFFVDENPLAAQAVRAMYPFLRKGGLDPEHYIARNIANIYLRITGRTIPYNNILKDRAVYDDGERVPPGSRQFHDGLGLKLVCVIVRELKLHEYISVGAPSDHTAPFPWQEQEIDGKPNPWEVTKNRFANIWENDKKRADRGELFGGDAGFSSTTEQTP